MKTVSDAIDVVYTDLAESSLGTAITGSIYKLHRPIGSRYEDVVISALPMTVELPPRCAMNVNIYVPNLVITGKDTLPNYKRLNALAKLALDTIGDNADSDYYYHTDSMQILNSLESRDYFMNIRLDFFFTNNT